MTKLARGVYYETEKYYRLTPQQRFYVQCLALGCEGRSLAGRSAACLWGLPISSTGTLTVEVVGKTERTRARTVYRHVPPGGIVSAEVNGFRVLLTSPQLTVIDIARWHGIGEAVRVAEAALYKKVIDMEALERALTSRSRCHNMDQAREAMRFITGFSESPRESDLKIALFEAGYPPPYQQAEIVSSDGVFLGRIDFFYPHCSLGIEYDGRGKTWGAFGVEPTKAVNKERSRERALVSEGVALIRVDNASYVSGTWLKQLSRLINRYGPFPEKQWSSPGFAWFAKSGH